MMGFWWVGVSDCEVSCRQREGLKLKFGIIL
jgi:hypothetical protein